MAAVQVSMHGYIPGPCLPPPQMHPYLPPPGPVMPPPGFNEGAVPQIPQMVSMAMMNAPKPVLAPISIPATTATSGTVASATTTSTSGAAGQTSQTGANYDGRRMRSKTTLRKTVDYNASIVNWLHSRTFQRDHRDMRVIQPEAIYNHMIKISEAFLQCYQVILQKGSKMGYSWSREECSLQMVPPAMLLDTPVNSLCSRSVRMAMNKVKCPIFSTKWTPEGRRLVTGASSGEFTLWHGLTFSFETILQAHDLAVRSMVWSHNDMWMLTADHGGFVKYWQSNMNNVKMYQAHKEPVRGLSFCPSDQKFASCSDDGTVRVWDFWRCHEERIMRGHGADVRCVDWHPHRGIIASGSRDTQQPVKLWDPRTGASLSTVHAHKHTVMDLKWNKNGNWMLTASRDHLLKLFDIRNMKEEMQSFRGHKKEATTIAWHPIHESLFASGGSDGAIMFWLVGNEKELGSIDEAHDTMVWSMDWHPLGHILASGSNDHTTKFWTRNRPGDPMRDRYNLNTLPAGVLDECDIEIEPGVPLLGNNDIDPKTGDGDASSAPFIPGLDLSPDKSASVTSQSNSNVDGKFVRRKAIYTKPVPKDFERAWVEGRQPSIVSNRDIPEENSETHEGPGGLMNPYKWNGPSQQQPRPMNPDGSDRHPPMPRGPMLQGSRGMAPPRQRGPPDSMMMQRGGSMLPRPPRVRSLLSGGPQPLLSLNFDRRDGHSPGPSDQMRSNDDNQHFAQQPHDDHGGFDRPEYREGFNEEDAEYHGDQNADQFNRFDDEQNRDYRESPFDSREPSFDSREPPFDSREHPFNSDNFHPENEYPPMDSDNSHMRGRGGWRMLRGRGHQNEMDNRPQDLSNDANFQPRNNRPPPPSLLDMNFTRPRPTTQPPGLKRKWEEGGDEMDNRMPNSMMERPDSELGHFEMENEHEEGPRPDGGGRGWNRGFRGNRGGQRGNFNRGRRGRR